MDIDDVLQSAAENSDFEKAKRGINEETNVNIALSCGWTALIHAARNDYSEIVRFLIENGEDKNAVNV